VILHDRLIPAGALEGARPDAELVYVGKEGGGPSMDQDEINRLLVEHGRAGKQVVRLKGGDPFVFGRGGEEALVLREAGVPFTVVPGVTAGVAAPAYAGIPVTHRDRASAMALITPRGPDEGRVGARLGGAGRFPARSSSTWASGGCRRSVAADRRGPAGRRARRRRAARDAAGQRTVVAPLAELADAAREAGVRPPSITVVGPAVGLHEELAWFGTGPLAGARVAVTRARAQASGLARTLRELEPRRSRRPRSGSSRSTPPCRTWAATTSSA